MKGVGSETILCEGMGTLSGPLAGFPAYYCPSLKVSILSKHRLIPHVDIARFDGSPDGMMQHVVSVDKQEEE